jgi:hypothetical protein
MPETTVTVKLTPRKWRVIVECLKFSKAVLELYRSKIGDAELTVPTQIFIKRMIDSDPNHMLSPLDMQRAVLYILKDLDAE